MAIDTLAGPEVACEHCGRPQDADELDDEFRFCPDCMSLVREWESAQADAEDAAQALSEAGEGAAVLSPGNGHGESVPRDTDRLQAAFEAALRRLADAESALDACKIGG